jgi:hypothetical protein
MSKPTAAKKSDSRMYLEVVDDEIWAETQMYINKSTMKHAISARTVSLIGELTKHQPSRETCHEQSLWG